MRGERPKLELGAGRKISSGCVDGATALDGEVEVLQGASLKLAYSFKGSPTQIPTVYPTPWGAGDDCHVSVRGLAIDSSSARVSLSPDKAGLVIKQD